MEIKLDYYDIETAVIDYMNKIYGLDIDSDQIVGSNVEVSSTPACRSLLREFRKSKGDNTSIKKERIQFDTYSEFSFYIDQKEDT